MSCWARGQGKAGFDAALSTEPTFQHLEGHTGNTMLYVAQQALTEAQACGEASPCSTACSLRNVRCMQVVYATTCQLVSAKQVLAGMLNITPTQLQFCGGQDPDTPATPNKAKVFLKQKQPSEL